MDRVTRVVIGFDVGDRKSVAVSLDRETGEMIQLPAVPTSHKSAHAFLDSLAEPVTIVLEASTPARWIAREGRIRGHQMIVVADRRRPSEVTEDVRKSDEADAAMLVGLGGSEMRRLREAFDRNEAKSLGDLRDEVAHRHANAAEAGPRRGVCCDPGALGVDQGL